MDIKLIIYYLCIGIGAAVSSAVSYFSGRKAGFSKKTLGMYISLGLVIGIFSALLMGQLQNFIMSLTGLEYYPSRLRIFGALLFTPPLFYFPVKYLAGDFHQVMDVFSAGIYAMLGISKIGCAVYGCCYGIACSPGITTPFETHTVFPVQLLETVLSIVISITVLLIAANKKHRKGTVYPLSLILYGVMRFFVEYLRYYPEAERTYFFGMNFWQAVSIVTVITGTVWFIYKHYGSNPGLQKV